MFAYINNRLKHAVLEVQEYVLLTWAAVRGVFSPPIYAYDISEQLDAIGVQSLTVDGQTRPVQLEDGRLRLTLAPGSQSVVVVWQEPTGLSAVLAAPHVRLGAAAVNARVEIECIATVD